MKTQRTKLRATFGRETRYDLVPIPAVPYRGTCETELEQFKQQLLRRALDSAADAELYAPLRRAANEAAAVAWTTPFPLLFLPGLFEEKRRTAETQAVRQKRVRARSRQLLKAADVNRTGSDELLVR